MARCGAVLVTPAGGYQRVVVDKEGYALGHWLAERGFTVFVLFYRLPGEGWAAGPDVARSDAQRARGIPVETRLFAHGGHGFGVRNVTGKPVGAWPDLFVSWAQSMRLIQILGPASFIEASHHFLFRPR